MIADAAEPLPDIGYPAFAALFDRYADSQAILPHQFDGWVWFDETEAVTPLPGEVRQGEQASADETWPFGL